ncbi:MAG TPA: energy transducer TonB [Pyrinomonadaceae bacterium]|nr:energy transducer TonB [Pyrinomonadaceae bacterium]
MFNNLIESSSHAREFKRRGSFLLFTTATYVLLFSIAGVASIYAYDAHLEAQSTDLQLLTYVPVDPAEPQPEIIRNTIRPASDSENPPTRSTRIDLIDSASNPHNVPDEPGTKASDVPPARPDSVRGTFNADLPTPAFTSSRGGVPGGTGDQPVVNLPDPPPAALEPKPVTPKVLKISVVLNSKALDLPQPTYPALARQIRLKGSVSVQVLIDESGNVISAKALSGHQVFIKEAESAARRARFSPTKINDQPVKVQGVITYNFVMN